MLWRSSRLSNYDHAHQRSWTSIEDKTYQDQDSEDDLRRQIGEPIHSSTILYVSTVQTNINIHEILPAHTRAVDTPIMPYGQWTHRPRRYVGETAAYTLVPKRHLARKSGQQRLSPLDIGYLHGEAAECAKQHPIGHFPRIRSLGRGCSVDHSTLQVC